MAPTIKGPQNQMTPSPSPGTSQAPGADAILSSATMPEMNKAAIDYMVAERPLPLKTEGAMESFNCVIGGCTTITITRKGAT